MAHASEDNREPLYGAEEHDPGTDNQLSDLTPAPATTLRLILGAIAMQAGSKMMSDAVDRAIHGAGTEAPTAKPGKIKTSVAGKLAKIATKSKPGAIAVAGGLLVKHIFDRGGKRRQAKREAAKRP